MSELADKNVYRVKAIFPFKIEEIHQYLKVDGWDVKKDKLDFHLIKNFRFKNFIESQKFVNKVIYCRE